MKPHIHLRVELFDGEGRNLPIVRGTITRECSAALVEDNEENCVRLAEQMVRTAFRKLREKMK